MAVLYQLVLFVIYSVAELGFQEYERLLLKFFVFLFHKAWIELIPIVLLAVFEPPSLLILLEIVQVEASCIDYLLENISVRAMVRKLDLGYPFLFPSIKRVADLQADMFDLGCEQIGHP